MYFLKSQVLFHGVPLTSGPGHRENIYLLGHAVCDVITKTLGVREELVITEMFRSQTSNYNYKQQTEFIFWL